MTLSTFFTIVFGGLGIALVIIIVLLAKILIAVNQLGQADSANPQPATTDLLPPQTTPPVFVPETVRLFDVDDQTAAMLMAIVSDFTQTPLSQLRFKSIKPVFDVDDKTAAMIMAIVSDQTHIPLNELHFKSIKPVK